MLKDNSLNVILCTVTFVHTIILLILQFTPPPHFCTIFTFYFGKFLLTLLFTQKCLQVSFFTKKRVGFHLPIYLPVFSSTVHCLSSSSMTPRSARGPGAQQFRQLLKLMSSFTFLTSCLFFFFIPVFLPSRPAGPLCPSCPLLSSMLTWDDDDEDSDDYDEYDDDACDKDLVMMMMMMIREASPLQNG